jgi:predicted nucleic acid-binding protein
VPEPPVTNASPLIVLARAELSNLLLTAGPQVLVPVAVAGELQRRGHDDPAVQLLTNAAWIQVVDTGPIPERIQQLRLGPGESAVLAWALAHPGTEAIIDDLPARHAAASLGIPVRGTLGLILAAKEDGTVTAARPLIERVRAAGLYRSDDVIARALARIGE